MKKISRILALIISVFCINASQAQESSTYEGSEFFPKAGDFGTSIIIDGLIDNINLTSTSTGYGQNILFAKYYLKDDIVLRAGFGFDLNNSKRETADSSGVFLVEVDSLTSNYNINISGGIEKHLSASRRLDPYVFSQMDITFIGKTKTESETRLISSAGTNKTERTIKRDGGLAFGIQAGGGFNYFLTERFSIGTELAFKIQYVKLGGTISDNTITSVTNGNPISNFESREDLTKTATIKAEPNALINISYFF